MQHKKRKKRYLNREVSLFMSCRSRLRLLSSSTGTAALLLNTGSLTSELTQIVKLRATNLTNLVHLDALNVWRLDGEDTLYTNGT